MTAQQSAGSLPLRDALRASLPAALLGLLLAVALKQTALSPAVATGISVAAFFVAQAVFLQWVTGRRSSARGWAMIFLLTLIAAVASGIIMEL